jgi:hypothetical protein
MTQHDRRTERLGQPLHLVIDGGAKIVPIRGIRHGRGNVGRQCRDPAASRPDSAGGPVGDTVQPARQRSVLADGSHPSRQDEEGGLEGVLGVLLVPEQSPANAQHHRPVSAQDDRERRRVSGEELLHQFAIARELLGVVGQPARDLPQCLTQRALGPRRGGHVEAHTQLVRCPGAMCSLFCGCARGIQAEAPFSLCRGKA